MLNLFSKKIEQALYKVVQVPENYDKTENILSSLINHELIHHNEKRQYIVLQTGGTNMETTNDKTEYKLVTLPPSISRIQEILDNHCEWSISALNDYCMILSKPKETTQ